MLQSLDDANAGPLSSEDGEHSEEGEGDEHPDDEDDTGSFISETFSDEELPADELPEEHDGEDEEDEGALLEAALEAELANMPTVPMPTIYLTDPSPPDSPEKKVPTLATDSSTPPGSPDKQPPVAAPTPVAATTPSTFGFGAGRPSTKPTRSSPLANAPISGRDSEDDTTEKLPQHRTSASVEPAVTKLPSSGVPTEGKSALASRPKTPPTLSLLGSGIPLPKPSPFTLAPSAAPVPTVFSIPPATSPSLRPNNPGAQATPQKASSVFSPPSTSTPSAKQQQEIASTEATRATAPLFPQGGLFGQPKPNTPTNVFGGKPESAPGSAIFPAPPTGPLFGQKTTTGATSPATQPPASRPGSLPMGGIFAQKPAAPPPSVSGASPLFGTKAATPPLAPQGAFPAGGLFAQKPPTPAATAPAAGGSPFGSPSAFPPPPATTPAGVPVMEAGSRPTDRIDPLAQLADGMQKECINLLLSMARELEIVSPF